MSRKIIVQIEELCVVTHNGVIEVPEDVKDVDAWITENQDLATRDYCKDIEVESFKEIRRI